MFMLSAFQDRPIYSISVFVLTVKALAHLCGAVRFLLHAKQANFLYFVHLGDFSQQFSLN